MGKATKLILAGIIIFAGVVRLTELDKSPPAVNWDEAALGYNAYSLWLTGKDEYGSKLPISLRSFDDYKPPLYSYLTAPIVGIWGLNEVNTRLISAIAGVMAVFLVYLIAKNIYLTSNPSPTLGEGNHRGEVIGLISATLMAVEPYSVMFSRGAWEANLSLTFTLVCIYWLQLAQKKSVYLAGAIILAGVNTWVYHSAKVYFLLVLVWVVWQLKTKLLKQKRWWFIILLGMSPLVLSGLLGGGLARLGSTSISKVWQREKSAYSLAINLAGRYLAYFSPVNLFVRGSNEPNQNITGFAPFYPFEFWGWVPGLIWLFTNRKKNSLFAGWVFIGSLPAIITWNWFTPIRVLPLLVSFTILTAIGWTQIINKINPTILKWGLAAAVLVWGMINFGWLANTLRWYVPYFEYGKWQWGFRETMTVIKPLIPRYSEIIWETPQAQPHIFTLFYGPYPPAQYHADLGGPNTVPSPRENFDYGKFTFRKIYWPTDRNLKNVLFIGNGYSLPDLDLARDNVSIIKEIVDPQGYVVYRIVGT